MPDVSLLQRNVIKATWRGSHRATASTAAPAPPESRSVHGSSFAGPALAVTDQIHKQGAPASPADGALPFPCLPWLRVPTTPLAVPVRGCPGQKHIRLWLFQLGHEKCSPGGEIMA